ncbi:porimin [Xenopus laevis]|uniref:Porimin n=2 Tax=Xenopus laevis TaxID=8355 RepID=A0A974DKP7_XENLA|nr:porimin [Xenopus laevis]OCT93190.1 hypothetical protein XELAEV_18016255mg [Xenopus laevis]
MRLPGNKWLGAALLLVLTVSCRVRSDEPTGPPSTSTEKTITSAPVQPTAGSNITDSNTTEPASKDNTTSPVAPTSAVSSTNQSTLAPPTSASTVKPVANTSEATTNVPAKTSATASASTSAATSAVTSSIASQVSPQISGFDLGSFIGGIVLTVGIIAVLFFACKFYNSRRGVQYRTIDEHEAII